MQIFLDQMLKLLICVLIISFQNFLQYTLRKKRESGEFIEIATNDIFSQVLSNSEYSGHVQARGHNVGIREFFSKPQRGLRLLHERQLQYEVET